MDQLTVYGIALVPVLVGLNELLKRSGVPTKYIPISSLIMGFVFSFYYLAPGDFKRALLLGVVIGLSAMGLYSGTKHTIASIRKIY